MVGDEEIREGRGKLEIKTKMDSDYALVMTIEKGSTVIRKRVRWERERRGKYEKAQKFFLEK